MSKGKRRREFEQQKVLKTVLDIERHGGLSRYERKKLARKGIIVKETPRA